MNVELLREVQKQILAKPDGTNIWRWLIKDVSQNKQLLGSSCGTVGCIAGWTCLVSKVPFEYEPIFKCNPNVLAPAKDQHVTETAQEKLGLTFRQADNLFYPDLWPEEWRDKLRQTNPQTPKHAQVIADYIDFFIRKNGDVNGKE